MNNKKDILNDPMVPLVLGIITLIVLTISATYAYFKITSVSNSNTTRVDTNVESVGSVNLNRINNNLSIHLTSINMKKRGEDISYYASNNGITTTETIENIGEVVAVGNGNFSCEYDMHIEASSINSMYTAFQNMPNKSSGQIILSVNGTNYDFNDISLFPKVVHNTITGISEGNTKYIKASLMIVNKKSIDQSSLAGTDITISFTINNFHCTLT